MAGRLSLARKRAEMRGLDDPLPYSQPSGGGGGSGDYAALIGNGSQIRTQHMDRTVISYHIYDHELDELFAVDKKVSAMTLAIGACSGPAWELLKHAFDNS